MPNIGKVTYGETILIIFMIVSLFPIFISFPIFVPNSGDLLTKHEILTKVNGIFRYIAYAVLTMSSIFIAVMYLI